MSLYIISGRVEFGNIFFLYLRVIRRELRGEVASLLHVKMAHYDWTAEEMEKS